MKKPSQPKSTHWQASLRRVLKQHNGTTAGGSKTASFATQAARQQVLWQGFKQLRLLGYRLKDVHSFREKHLYALAEYWEGKGLSPARLQNNISIFRTFSGWIGKRGMIRASHYYVQSSESVKRAFKTQIDKTWSGQGVNVEEKLKQVEAIDKRVATVLRLQATFGLRVKEASLLRIHQADRQHYLQVNWGTKGGRHRIVPIENDRQREALNQAKALVRRKSDSLIPRAKNFRTWQNYFYHVCHKAGISRKHGLTSHGLRHERLNEIYQERTGSASPIKGQVKGSVSKEDDQVARQEVAGHSRSKISGAYLG